MWKLKIEDPSGETRWLPAKERGWIGRSPQADFVLRDPTAPSEAARLEWRPKDDGSGSYWIAATQGAPAIRVWGVSFREIEIPESVPVFIGESSIVIERAASEALVPTCPPGTRPWVTASREGAQVLWITRKVAATPLSVFVGGETGTGKEVIAELIHKWSDRAAGPFVPINCGALPLGLAESELFGHAKGAFTGAVSQRPGAFLQAHGGTLFLDEIADLPPEIQVKLLRFLENGEIRPVGSDHVTRADVRLVSATHRPLKALVEEGKFRRDLYYRIASVTIEIPPLRTRPEDISTLATRFAKELERSLAPRAILRLQAHEWPGNVRELRHSVERAAGVSGRLTEILDEDAFDFLRTPENTLKSPGLEVGVAAVTLKEMERAMLIKALRIADGNRANAAKILGVARSTLFEMLKRHRIQGPKARACLPLVA